MVMLVVVRICSVEDGPVEATASARMKRTGETGMMIQTPSVFQLTYPSTKGAEMPM